MIENPNRIVRRVGFRVDLYAIDHVGITRQYEGADIGTKSLPGR